MLEKLQRIRQQLIEGFVPQIPKLTPEQITPEAIADIISGYIIGNPNAPINRGMDVEKRIITVDTILINAGHIPSWADTDMMQAFPQEHQATRVALNRLVQNGILSPRKLKNNQNAGYSVTNYEKLVEFAAKYQQEK
jgi:hypothetical protein